MNFITKEREVKQITSWRHKLNTNANAQFLQATTKKQLEEVVHSCGKTDMFLP
jgi:hypothetical protein